MSDAHTHASLVRGLRDRGLLDHSRRLAELQALGDEIEFAPMGEVGCPYCGAPTGLAYRYPRAEWFKWTVVRRPDLNDEYYFAEPGRAIWYCVCGFRLGAPPGGWSGELAP